MNETHPHSEELTALRSLVGPIAASLAADGHRLYLVGGVVRDLLLGANGSSGARSGQLHDIDLTTAARPAVIRRALEPLADSLWTQGERFGTIGAEVGGRALEITTHRAEVYDPKSRKPVVSFGDDLVTDLSRRDFTINAMAIDVADGVLHDPHGGREDLDQRVLRTPLDPEISFGDDPLRMLRAARFIPRLDLAVDPLLFAAASAMADRLAIVSRERIHDEVERLLDLVSPEPGLRFLTQTGLLAHVVPGLAGDEELAVDLAVRGETATVRRAALLWLLGSHDASDVLQTLRYPSRDRRQTVALIESCHRLLAATTGGAGDDRAVPALRFAAHGLGREHLDDLVALLGIVGGEAVAELAASRLAALAASEDLANFEPPVDGAQIMKLLGIGPGREVGEAVDHLFDLRIEQGPLSAADAKAELAAWWGQR